MQRANVNVSAGKKDVKTRAYSEEYARRATSGFFLAVAGGGGAVARRQSALNRRPRSNEKRSSLPARFNSLAAMRSTTLSSSLPPSLPPFLPLSLSLSLSRSRPPLPLDEMKRAKRAYREERTKERTKEETNGWTDSISQGPFCTTFSCFFFGYTSDELVRGSRRERTQ